LLPALVILFLDQISKLVVLCTIPLHGVVEVIGGFFNLVHVRNRGIAFGILNRPGGAGLFYVLMVLATVGAVCVLLFWFRKVKRENPRLVFGIALILGGAVGNLIDRLRLKEVVDFLDFFLGPYHWPAFNLADSAITVGTLWVAAHLLFHHPSKR
jgi:signal peptidase II